MHILIGFFVGALCGIIPLAYGLLTQNKWLAIVSVIVTSVFGIVFGILEKSPFTSIGVAIVFIVILFAKNKNKNSHHDEDHDIYND